MLRRFSAFVLPIVLVVTAFPCQSQSANPQKIPAILGASEAGSILPSSVFFRGQSASVQARNSAGIRLSKDSLLLVALVDASGYSSSIQQKYQAYLITESTVEIGGHRLSPGAYGCGFIANDTFLVMDIGGHDLFTAKSTRDTELHRPTPLQILQTTTAGRYRLYAGRNFVELSVSQ